MRRWLIFLLGVVTATLLSSELALSLPIFGIGPDLLIIVVVAFAAGSQPRTAALEGFAAGLVRDMLLSSPKGLSGLAYALTAYGVALLGEVRGVWAFLGIVSAATLVSQTIFGFVATLFSQNASLAALPRVALLVSAYNALLAPLVLPLLRRLEAGGRAESDKGPL